MSYYNEATLKTPLVGSDAATAPPAYVSVVSSSSMYPSVASSAPTPSFNYDYPTKDKPSGVPADNAAPVASESRGSYPLATLASPAPAPAPGSNSGLLHPHATNPPQAIPYGATASPSAAHVAPAQQQPVVMKCGNTSCNTLNAFPPHLTGNFHYIGLGPDIRHIYRHQTQQECARVCCVTVVLTNSYSLHPPFPS
jgi:hypothetical protein